MGGIDVMDDARDTPDLAEGELDLGARLKDLRKRKRWTLQQAADRTGVGLSTLSKIERNELSPTFSTLQKIAAGFEMDPAAIIGGQPAAAPVLRVPGRRALTRAGEGRPFPTGTCNNAWLCPDLTQKVMTPIKTTIVARSIDDYPEWAKYEAEMFLYVLSGTVVIHSQIYEPLRLDAGDSLYYDASTPHLWVSEGDTDAEVLWVYAKYQ
ncbi:helix-turn-helix domain-containing protein [Azospirillum canadense]|uniref:helix-turn-helix domain-containing protein n=1 Tax=Azospirillum canadense TaxID=403962 RepID=UPI0022279120|nr:XRE family transcriptional regulator [Azospirillum canadense]MCW2238756.1 transcriptional regulator with XRE-family HTH domain [Azospirillum canadense]